MAILGNLLLDLIKKAGKDPADPKYKDLIAFTSEVPDDIQGDFLSNLFGLEEAKKNARVKAALKSEFFDGHDKNLYDILDELNFSDEAKAEIKADPNSFGKFRKALAKYDELASKKYSDLTTTEKKELVKNYEIVKKEKSDLQAKYDADMKAKDTEYDSRMLDFAVNSYLQNKPYANKELTAQENAMVARERINAKLAEGKGKLVFDKTKNAIVIKDAEVPDAEFLHNGKSVTYTDFVDSILAEGNMVTVSQSGQRSATNRTGDTRSQFEIPADKKLPQSNQAAINRNQQRLDEMNG